MAGLQGLSEAEQAFITGNNSSRHHIMHTVEVPHAVVYR